jgi:hypothetical protein
MATFKITDPTTGQSYNVTGDQAPTQQEATELFASQTPQKKTGAMEGLYNLIARPTVEGFKGYGDLISSAGKTALGSMLSNGASGNTTSATNEGLAIKEAISRGDMVTAKKLAEQSRSRYNTSGQISDKMLSGGQNILDSANIQRQENGMAGSFDQGLASGLTTTGIGALKGAGGVLSALDVVTLGKASLAKAGLKNVATNVVKGVAQRGVRNALINAPLYGTGNIAQTVRENVANGRNATEGIPQSAWEGITGSNPVGVAEGITGDKKIAPLADIVMSLAFPMSGYGRWADKTATGVVNAPEKIIGATKNKFQEVKDFLAKPNAIPNSEDIPASATAIYKSRFVRDARTLNRVGKVDRLDSASNTAIRNGWGKLDNTQNSEVIDKANSIIGDEIIRPALENSNEYAKIDDLTDEMKKYMATKSAFTTDPKMKNAFITEVTAILGSNSGVPETMDSAGNLNVAGKVKLSSLYDANTQLWAEWNLYDQAYNFSRDPAMKQKADAINLVRQAVKNRIDSAPITAKILQENKDKWLPELAKIAPATAKDIEGSQGTRGIQRAWSDLLTLKENSEYSNLREQRNMKGVQEFMRTVAGVIGFKSPLLSTALYLGAPLVQQPVNTFTQQSKGGLADLLTKLSALKKAQ